MTGARGESGSWWWTGRGGPLIDNWRFGGHKSPLSNLPNMREALRLHPGLVPGAIRSNSCQTLFCRHDMMLCLSHRSAWTAPITSKKTIDGVSTWAVSKGEHPGRI